MRKSIFAALLLVLISPLSIFAQTDSEQLHQKEEEIKSLEQKIAELKSQSKTLSNQIGSMDSQIKITQLRISQTTEQIATLEGKIDRLEITLNHFSTILENRISNTYKQAHINPWLLLISSKDLSNFFLRFKYLKAIQLHDRKLITQIAQTQSNYQDQKQEEEKLKTELEKQKKLLGQQINEKKYLLEVTKSDEKKYQALLISAKAEQDAIRSALRTINLNNGTEVAKGDMIALIGNSGAPGCSSGPHLHFEVLRNGQAQNPSEYLKPSSITWDNNPDSQFSFSGNWDFPVSNPKITQGFGMTYWARLGWYNGGPHTGIDMVSDDPLIHTPQAGTLYKGHITCRGSTMNYVAVDHGSGIISWYWHVR